MSIPIENFAFDGGLVRVVEREDAPWFVGVDVCRALEFAKPENALLSLDDDEKYTLTEGVIDGDRGPNARIVVSEPGVYRLVFRSRKPAAERFKRWLAHEVLPALRKKGSYGQVLAEGAAPPPPTMMPTTYLEALSTVRELRMISGPAVAREAWRRLGLPGIHIDTTIAVDEARRCLQHLLEASIGRMTVREALEEAMEGDQASTFMLREIGVKPVREGARTGFMVGNRNDGLLRIYKGTEWCDGHWRRLLRRLPGAEAGRVRFDDGQERSTFVPEKYLDPMADVSAVASH